MFFLLLFQVKLLCVFIGSGVQCVTSLSLLYFCFGYKFHGLQDLTVLDKIVDNLIYKV